MAWEFRAEGDSVGHENISMNQEAIAFMGTVDDGQESSIVFSSSKYRFLLISSRRDVVKSSLEFDAEWSCHDNQKVTSGSSHVKT